MDSIVRTVEGANINVPSVDQRELNRNYPYNGAAGFSRNLRTPMHQVVNYIQPSAQENNRPNNSPFFDVDGSYRFSPQAGSTRPIVRLAPSNFVGPGQQRKSSFTAQSSTAASNRITKRKTAVPDSRNSRTPRRGPVPTPAVHTRQRGTIAHSQQAAPSRKPRSYITIAPPMPPHTYTNLESFWGIRPGSYVLYQLDVGQIALRFPEGSEAREALKSLGVQRHLGLVQKAIFQRKPESNAVAAELVINYVAAAPPTMPGVGDQCMMVGNSSESREHPLRTNTPLPFPKVVQCTTIGTSISLTNICTSSSTYALEPGELERFKSRAAMDQEEANKRLKTWSQKEKVTFAQSQVSPRTVPAQIWQDVSSLPSLESDPTSFVQELTLADYWYRHFLTAKEPSSSSNR